jgi:3',5'-cyclic AMP phosphodiesterase CpdA
MMRIAHLSDPHFGTIRPGLKEGLLATLTELRPEVVVITGDITQRAHARQFQEACAFKTELREAGMTVLLIPGNHDIPLFNVPVRLFAPYRSYENHCHPTTRESWEGGEPGARVRIDVLDSTSRWRIVQGALTAEDLESLALAGTGEAPLLRILGFHHPMDCAQYIDDGNLLKNRVAAAKTFARAGIDLVLGGHIHDPYVSLSQDRYAGLDRPFITAVAGTCLSSRVRPSAPNSFNWIELDPSSIGGPQLRITRMDIGADQRYRAVQMHPFARGATGWVRVGTPPRI